MTPEPVLVGNDERCRIASSTAPSRITAGVKYESVQNLVNEYVCPCCRICIGLKVLLEEDGVFA